MLPHGCLRLSFNHLRFLFNIESGEEEVEFGLPATLCSDSNYMMRSAFSIWTLEEEIHTFRSVGWGKAFYTRN
jgi:hypothetical protein